MSSKILRVLLLIGIIFVIQAQASFGLEDLTGYVNDEAGVISPDFEAAIQAELESLRENTSVEMAVATVRSLNGVPIEEYSLSLAHEVLGDEKKDNGILILLAVDDREYRIEVGYGLEPVISASLAGRVGREVMTPEFAKGDYEQGLIDGVFVISRILKNDTSWETEAANAAQSASAQYAGLKTDLIVLIIIILVFIAISVISNANAAKNSGGVKSGGSRKDPDFDAAALAIILFGRGGGRGGGSFGGSSGFGGFSGGSFGGGGFSGKF